MLERQVPWRTIIASIGSVIAAAALVAFIWISARVLLWIMLAALIAMMLNPAVDFFERRIRCRRSLAVALVMAGLTLVCVVLGFIVVSPIVSEGTNIATNLPTFLEEARADRKSVV